MRRTLYAAAILALIAVGGCKKDDDDDPSIPSTFVQKGSIRFKNTSPDLYDIYLDDFRYGSLYGGNESTYPSIPVGTHNVKAIQTSHISGKATLRQQVVIIYKDSVSTFSFP